MRTSTTGPTMQVTSLVEGVYKFKLTVIDNKGYANSDTVKTFVVYPELRNEMKFENLSWSFFHDPNNPIDDDLYIVTPPMLRSSLFFPMGYELARNNCITKNKLLSCLSQRLRGGVILFQEMKLLL
jgi:hypothetical protein